MKRAGEAKRERARSEAKSKQGASEKRSLKANGKRSEPGAKGEASEAETASQPHPKHSGDDGKRVPPVPIPNTEVKPLSAEGTWLATAREIRTPPETMKAEVSWLLLLK